MCLAAPVLFISLLASWSPARAQPAAATRPELAGKAAFLITMGPGPAIWERFGHNAIAVLDHDAGRNVAYNFGIFDFDDSDFIARFLRGDMRYWMAAGDAVLMVHEYQSQDRDVWGQELAFSPAQADALHAALEHNALPENKYYTYNYYTDNCSTRVRDAIDRIAGGEVKRQLEPMKTGTTYRKHTRRAMSRDRVIGFGIDYSLSAYADRELNAWEESFLPVELMKHLRRVTIADASGKRVPLVARDRSIHESGSPQLAVPDRPPTWWPALLGIGVAGGAAMALAGYAARRSRFGRLLAAVLWAAWGLVAGFGGWYLTLMWIATSHRAAYANENLLQTFPAVIAFVVLGPMAAFGRATKIARWLAVACLAMALIGLLAKALPPFAQDNCNVLVLTLPLNAALAAGIFLRSKPLPAGGV